MNETTLARLLAFATELHRATTFEELLITTRVELEQLMGYTHAWLSVATGKPREWRLVDLVGAKRGLVDAAGAVREDPILDEVARTDALVVEQRAGRTFVHVPLHVLDAPLFVLGTGAFEGDDGRAPRSDELAYFVEMGRQLGAAVGRIRLAQAQARRSEARFRRLTESGIVGIVISDMAGNITEVNDAFLEIVGYSREELISGKVSGRELNTPERDRTDAVARRQIAERGMAPAWEKELVRKDGTRIPVLTGVAVLEEHAGECVAFVLDLTEQKRAESFERDKNAAEAANEELEAFSYSVAHDLRAPLRGISGFVGAFLEDHGAGLDPAGVAQLGRVTSCATRMGEIIDALLSLARLSRTELRRERVNLAELTRAIVEQLRAMEPARVVKLVAPDSLFAEGDPGLLRTALENLLSNAWKFTRGPEDARIEVGSSVEPGRTTYFVRDNGAGFDMAYRDKLFQPFQRLHSTRQFEGTGVGLAIVARIVRRHGGTISAEAAVGAGATFRFTLAG